MVSNISIEVPKVIEEPPEEDEAVHFPAFVVSGQNCAKNSSPSLFQQFLRFVAVRRYVAKNICLR